MRVLLPIAFVAVATWTVSATAQVGLYGSPDMINFPAAESTTAPAAPSATVPASYSSQWSTRQMPYQAIPRRPMQPSVYAPAQQVAYPMAAPQQAAYPMAAPQQSAYPIAAPQQSAYAPVAQPVYAPAVRQAPPQAVYAQPSPVYAGPAPRKAPAAPTMPQVPTPAAQPQPTPSANVVDQMLSDPACCGAGNYAGSAAAGSACGNGGVYGACGTNASALGQVACGGCAPCPWYASATALIMGRNEGNRFFFTSRATNNADQEGLVHWQWRAGGEIRFGRRFCCGTWALEGAYWTLDSFVGNSVVHDGAGLNTPIQLDYVQFYHNAGDAPMATDLIDGAIEHRLWRRSEVHSAEVNILREGMLCDACHPLDVNWGVGARFFRFEDDLQFGALHNGSWGADPTQEAYINDNLKNNLFGVQLTLDMNYYLNPNWRVFVTPRFGIYGNHIEQHFNVRRGDGVVGRSTDPNTPGYFPVNSTADVVSFLTQVDLGVSWAFARNWSVGCGYRVVVATGIGLTENQIPTYLVDMPEIARIDYNGELLLHGAFANLTYNF